MAENYKPLYTIFQDQDYPFNAHSRSQVVYYNFVKFQYQLSVHPFRSSWTDKKYGQTDGKYYLFLPLSSFCLRRYISNFTPSHPFRRSWTDKKYGQKDESVISIYPSKVFVCEGIIATLLPLYLPSIPIR